MENKLIMASDIIHALVQFMSEYGDCPVAIADSNSPKAMVPVENVHMMSIKEKDSNNKGENLIIIADFTITDTDGTSMGYFHDK